jgi:hypothetical protein
MTEQQMKNFPHLKEAILTNKTVYVESPSQEMDELRGVLDFFNTERICYQNEYYQITIKYVDAALVNLRVSGGKKGMLNRGC